MKLSRISGLFATLTVLMFIQTPGFASDLMAPPAPPPPVHSMPIPKAPSTPVSISTSSMPSGTVGNSYTVFLRASGGSAFYNWSLSSGALPTGLSLSRDLGIISGTLTAAGTFNFIITVADKISPTHTASRSYSVVATAPHVATPVDVREITFPADMTAWGWMDVTKNGPQVATGATPNLGCPNAIPNLTDAASVTQTTQAIQCRLTNLGFYGNPGSLYFPAGTYYINKSLSITYGAWAQNHDGSYTFHYYGNWDRSNDTGEIHISGQDPATTKIMWAGSCGTDPNIANPGTVTKYNDIFYINTSGSPFVMERLTLDGNQSCAGSGLDFVSKPLDVSGITIHEMNIQNLREVGIVGDRPNMTFDELRTGTDSYGNPYSENDGTGMISEVSISQVNFSNVGYACVMPDSYNAVDWWIRDSTFDHCNIGVINNTKGVSWTAFGQPQTPALPWGDNGLGGFEVANSIFTNSQTVDISGGNAVRNSYSIASHGPFIEASGEFLAIGNTVVASTGIVPIMILGGKYGIGLPQLTLMQNQIITQNNGPVVTSNLDKFAYSTTTGYFTAVSPIIGNLWNETYGSIASIGNKYSSTSPFVEATPAQMASDVNWFNNIPNWTADSSKLLQCGPLGGGLLSPIDNRTYCNFSNLNWSPVYNVLTSNDQTGVQIMPKPPTLPPVRPIVQRNYIVASLNQSNSQQAAIANSAAIQNAINTLASNQSRCAANDYACPDRWAIVYLPSGKFPIGSTINIPGSVQLQVVGTGQTNLFWYWNPGLPPPAPLSGMFKLHAPAHVMMRDFNLYGQDWTPAGNALGEGLVIEVTDLTDSRIVTDKLVSGSLVVAGIGNAAFQMKSFSNGGANTIMGNNGQNSGYFSFFSGNPYNLTVGKGANVMIQDTWYEGSDSNYINCADGDQANITVESSMISMAGWHGDASTASNLTTFNIGGCATKTTLINNSIGRQVCGPPNMFYSGFPGGCLAPSPDMILPATSTAATQVLFLNNGSSNSTYADSNGDTTSGVIPENYSGTIDQGYVLVDPNTHAQYANLLGTFGQSAADNGSNAYFELAAKNTGLLQQSFVNTMVGQALDPRLISALSITPPITNMQATDVLLEHVLVIATKLDMQFVLPGAATQ